MVQVAPDSPADDAELEAGDIIQAINGRPIHTLAEARRELQQMAAGRPIFLLVSRDGTMAFLRMRKD